LVEADGVTTPNGRTLTALVVLAAEVRRLRAAVEAVRALPEYYFSDIYPLVYRDDVLRILEGE
jgi:hypothetical protein